MTDDIEYLDRMGHFRVHSDMIVDLPKFTHAVIRKLKFLPWSVEQRAAEMTTQFTGACPLFEPKDPGEIPPRYHIWVDIQLDAFRKEYPDDFVVAAQRVGQTVELNPDPPKGLNEQTGIVGCLSDHRLAGYIVSKLKTSAKHKEMVGDE